MARRSKKDRFKSKDGRLEVDLTPMIDVVFNLLIFFLCLPFRASEGELDATTVGGQGPGIPGGEKVVVRIEDSRSRIPRIYLGHIRLQTGRNGEPKFDLLAERLAFILSKRIPGTYVEIDSDPLVRYEYVVGAMNACVRARITDVRFRMPRELGTVRGST